MATYHISRFGSLASPDLRADLDGYVYTTSQEVLGGRWDGASDMSAEDGEEIARINVAATEESERTVERWRAEDDAFFGGDDED